MWTTIKLKQDCCIIVLKQVAVRNRRLLSLWQMFAHPKNIKLLVEILLARVWEYLKLVRTSHLKQCQASQSTITFSTWSRAFLQEIQHPCTWSCLKAQQPSFDTSLQTRNASSRNPYNMSNSVRWKVQFGVKTCIIISWYHIVWQVWFHIIASLRL